jgi:hypothetical protein
MRHEFFATIDTIEAAFRIIRWRGTQDGHRTVKPKISTNFMSAECKPFRIGFRSAAYARGHARGESHLRTLELTFRSTASLTLTPFPAHVRVPSVSSVSAATTPFHDRDPITFEDISKIHLRYLDPDVLLWGPVPGGAG